MVLRPAPGGEGSAGCARDEGVSLVEMVIAVFIVASVMLSGAAALISSTAATGRSTASTRATQLASTTLERLHSLPWNALGLYTNDPAFTTTFEGLATAALPATTSPDPRVPAAQRTVRQGGTDFTVRTSIVRLPDSDPTRAREAQRRMTVQVSWASSGRTVRVRTDGVRTPTTGESGNQCFALRSLEVTMVDSAAVSTYDPFLLTGERTVPSGSSLVVNATTNLPASGLTLTYPVINTSTAAVEMHSAAMSKVGTDDRSWRYTLPAPQQFPAGQQVFTASGTASASSPTCPTTTAALDSHPRFTHPAGAPPATRRIATGLDHSCWIDGAGRVWCWGQGSGNGALGVGNSNPSAVPVRTGLGVSGFANLLWISGGDEHTCAVAAGGSVWCWGLNTSGQLGDGTTTTRTLPVQVVGLSDAVAVSAGTTSTCALTRGGLVRCWGGNATGQLGNGTTATSLTASTRVLTLDKALGVSVGTDHACAVTSAGTVWCWGSGAGLRLNGAASTTTPVQVVLPGTPAPLARHVAVTTGNVAHSCVVSTGGQVYCWGANDRGQAAPGGPASTTVQQVSGVSGATNVTAGLAFTCATADTASGAEAWCWGNNNKGQTGNGTTGPPSPPTRVLVSTGMTGPVDLSAADDHTCVRTFDAAAWCWGQNLSGELGNGTPGDSSRPVRASGT